MKSLNGIFINANDETLNKIWTACALHGFTQDSDGVLKLLMLVVEGEEDEDEEEIPKPDPMKAIFEHIAANPDQARILKETGAKLFQSFMKGIKKG